MRLVPFIFLLLLSTVAFTQQNEYTAYTVNDGLPSNHVYQCVEDDHGFLWVATDAGIARFDGRFFQVFTTKHGLPDNEVLQVVKDNDGTIWINCFKQSPAYFDEVRNRFVNASEDSNLAKTSGTTNMFLYALSEGGVIYTNERGSFIFRNKKLTHYPFLVLQKNSDGSVIKWGGQQRIYPQTKGRIYFALMVNNKTVDSILVNPSFVMYPAAMIGPKKIFAFDKAGRKCYIFTDIRTRPLKFRADSIQLPESFFTNAFTADCFYIISNSARIYVYGKDDLQLKHTISGDFIPNGFYEDSRKNLWISTVDKGLVVYRKKQLASVKIPANFSNTNFLSITKMADGRLLAGNYYGEVIETGNHNTVIYQVIKKTPSRQRKIIIQENDIYTVSEDGVYINYKHPVGYLNGAILGAKTAMIYDDTTLILGTVVGFAIVDTRLKKTVSIHRNQRITAFAKGPDDIIYFGSINGLYKYNLQNKKHSALTGQINERVTALLYTNDSLLYIATSGNGIAIMKNDTIIARITENNGLINNSCRSISNGRSQQVWVGTSQGISIVTYTFQNNKLSFSVKNLSVNDGLTSNEINEMYFSNDTVYAATGNGISMIPAGLSLPSFNIPVRITAININQRDTLISTAYSLDAQQQNIQLQFAGIEINGHFKHFEYSLTGHKGWTYLEGRTLTLQLNSGKHILQVRAVDVNGHVSNNALTVEFNIAVPFWKQLWFWLVMAVMLQGLLLYFFHRWQKERKEIRLSKELAVVQTASLEQQAFTSLMNPHFMFNALNSIQHYINLQDRKKANLYLSDFASLIRKNFEASQQSFISLEQELDNIRIYLRLEQMRFADRFSYQIIIDENIDTEHWMIPTMMLQPLLENAILHGLMPSAIPGELTITFTQSSGYLLINIIDNGIGINHSLAAKQNTVHKSRGMELIRKRIKALGNLAGEPITVEMNPAYSNSTNPGNKVVLKIPAGLYDAWRKASRSMD